MARSAHSDDVLPIVRLVREKVAASELSLRSYAEQRGVAYSTLRRYHDKRLKPLSQPPRSETLRELALALDVPLGEVEQAAVESLSYRSAPGRLEPQPTIPASSVEDAIRNDPKLLPEARRHLLNQYGLLLRIRSEAEEAAREQMEAHERRELDRIGRADLKLAREMESNTRATRGGRKGQP